MGFTKLDEGIVLSSIWSESLATRVLWVTMLAMSDSEGLVSCSRSGLLRSANVPEDEFNKAIELLESSDKESRSSEHEGRRIEKCDGGWTILNYKKYREYTYSGSKEAIKKRKYREKLVRTGQVGTCPKSGGHRGTKAGDISASASGSISFNTINNTWEGITDADMKGWAEAYPACDITSEFAKMREWMLANPKKAKKSNYRRFIVNWLSKAQDRGGGIPSRKPGYQGPDAGLPARDVFREIYEKHKEEERKD